MENPFIGYTVTSNYGTRVDPINGSREMHRGIDLVKANKAPIKAFVGGTVRHAKMATDGSGLGGYGNVVAILDPAGTLHIYAHLNSINVSVNNRVQRGDVIGTQGQTGRATGSHLHYEVRLRSTPSYGYGYDTNPTNYLKAVRIPPPTLRAGNRGEAVAQLQLLLGVSADGIFGSITGSALKDWQRKHGLAADGIYGPKSYQMMLSL